MDKESIILLQKIDCNCNDCKFMIRDFDKYKSFDNLYTNEKGQVTSPSYRINYGFCSKLDKSVSFITNTCQLETQLCFEHRKN
jgi:hypothetical protein